MANTNSPSAGAPDNAPANTKNSSKENRFVAFLKRPVVFISLILLLVIVGVYLYMDAQVSEVRKQAALEQEAVIERANERIIEQNKYFLEVLTKPFSWALRTALLSGNVEQVDQYLFQFVQEDRFTLLVVADEEGNIISSTDQNYTGADFADHFSPDFLRADATVVDDTNPERIVVASPVMGFNSRLGTLLAVYQPEELLQNEQPEE